MSLRRSAHPLLLEANARLVLRRLAARRGADPSRPLALGDVTDGEWRELAGRAEILWLMGVWRRSAGSRAEALRLPGLRRAYDAALPGWTEADVAGSPYAVAAYELDPVLGAPGDLAAVHRRLNDLGIALVLDFVPNHVARDHSWTRERPELLVRGTDRLAREHPEWLYRSDGGALLAHGRDPHFPPWTDTAQLDLFSTETRAELVRTLVALSEVCDGVRCDMAMLALSDVFERTWSGADHAPRPERELWEEAIQAARARRPDFLFLAEGYWNTEGRLVELGFDHVYDKTLYDRLRSGTAAGVRAHLSGLGPFAARGAHFVENHDEPRAAAAFAERLPAALATILALPGLRFLHDGQLDGRRVRLPVQLAREPDEPPDAEIRALHERLLDATDAPAFRDGAYELLDSGHEDVVAWLRGSGADQHVVAVNLSPTSARAHVALPSAADRWRDALTGEITRAAAGALDLALLPWSPRIVATAR